MQTNTEKRLVQIRADIVRHREALRVLDEEVVHLGEVADDAINRAVVASTPLADRDRREALEDLRRITGERDRTRSTIKELLEEQDRLLDRFLA